MFEVGWFELTAAKISSFERFHNGHSQVKIIQHTDRHKNSRWLQRWKGNLEFSEASMPSFNSGSQDAWNSTVEMYCCWATCGVLSCNENICTEQKAQYRPNTYEWQWTSALCFCVLAFQLLYILFKLQKTHGVSLVPRNFKVKTNCFCIQRMSILTYHWTPWPGAVSIIIRYLLAWKNVPACKQA